MSRPSWDLHFLNIAMEVSRMSTCARRQVGCVVVDENRIMLSTGFNGVPPKFEHCRDNPGHECPGANSPSGTNLDGCWAQHAETNALLHCPDIFRIHTVYCTSAPCINCVKSLLCTRARRIVFIESYPHVESKVLWTKMPVILTRPGWRDEVLHRTWEQILSDGTVKVLASSLNK